MAYQNKKANNIVEYVLLFLLVGLCFGTALSMINPDIFKNAFRAVFGETNTNHTDYSITISPMSN